MKIVSLVPSITEALFDFGLTENEIVGRTKFCIHPKDKVSNVKRIGGTKNIDIEAIKSLKPDFIFANKEENVKEQVEDLQENHNVILTDVITLEDALELNRTIGKLIDKLDLAEEFNTTIAQNIHDHRRKTALKVAYLIWKNPYMTVGGDTYISHILSQLGYDNIFAEQQRYPEVSVEDLSNADLIFLSSEPYPFKEKDVEELKKHLQEVPIILVDGEVFSWYGTHLAKSDDYLQQLNATVNSLIK